MAVALLVGIVSFFLSFFIFNVAYISWAVHRYPHHNSMAGMAAFYYGFPVGGAVALVVFAVTLYLQKKRGRAGKE